LLWLSAGRLPVVFEGLDGGVVMERELTDIQENIHRDCFREVENSISRLHYQKEIPDLCCWPET
jgi:hypothetical protein